MTEPHPKPLAGRVALVTGASRGIGAAVAKRLAAAGAHLVLTARTVGGLEDVDDAIRAIGGTATLVPLDLRDLDRIDPLGPQLLQRLGRLDVFVGNAAILGTMGPLSHHDPVLWNDIFTINVTANWRLIRTLEPLLRQSDAARAIFVTSNAARRVAAFRGPYAASKAALEMLAKTWAAEMQDTKVRVNLVSPGRVRTRMRAQAFPGEDPMTLPTPEDAAELFLPLALPDCTRHGEIIEPYSST